MTGLTPTAVAELVRFLAQFPLLKTVFAGRPGPPQALDVDVGVAATTVPHSLRAVPRFIWPCLPDANAVVWLTPGSPPTATTFTVQASAPCRLRFLLA